MTKTGWEFIEPARRRGARFVRACVRVDDVFGEIPIAELQSWLEKMEFFDEPDAEWTEAPGTTPSGRTFDFQIWAEDGRLWHVGDNDGLARLDWLPSTPESWLQELRTSPYESGLSEMPFHVVRDKREDGPSYFARRPGETVPRFAERMLEIIRHSKVVVEIEAGHTVDIDFALEEVREIIDGNGKALAVRRVRKELDFARKYFPRLEIPAYPSDVETIDAALRLIESDQSGSRIVRTAGVMSGDPVVEGTRVPATTVLAEIFAGESEASIHEGYPSLPPGAVSAAIEWAIKKLADYRRAFLVGDLSVEQTPEIEGRHVVDMRKRGLESSLEFGPRIERNLRRLIDDRTDVAVMDGGAVAPPDTLIDAQLRLEAHYRDPAIVTILMYVVDTREIVAFRKGITKIITERYGVDEDEIYVAKGLILKTADIWDLDDGQDSET